MDLDDGLRRSLKILGVIPSLMRRGGESAVAAYARLVRVSRHRRRSVWRAGETPTTAVRVTKIDDQTMQFLMSQIDYGGPVDISKLFELEIAQWAEVDLRVAPRLVDDAAWGENREADEFMLQPGGIDAITEFWNWINDSPGSGGVGLHGDFNMTGSYDEWEEPRRLVERGERKLSDYGGDLPGIEPPEEWQFYFDWQRQLRLSEFGSGKWFELAQKMFDFTGDNVFVFGTVGEAPTSCSPTTTCATSPPNSRSPTPTGKATSCTGPTNSGSTAEEPPRNRRGISCCPAASDRA